jgi:hypothetical protein
MVPVVILDVVYLNSPLTSSDSDFSTTLHLSRLPKIEDLSEHVFCRFR